MQNEHVVLVDEENNVLGIMSKLAAHSASTPLHRAFSLFLFNNNGELLLQQRSHKKKTWPLVWSNSCCGHPQLNEKTEDAVRRRLKEELGMTVQELKLASSYRYKFTHDGIMENEICPIYVGYVDQANDTPKPNPDEVEQIKWLKWQDFLAEIKIHPENYSEWCVEEALILSKIMSVK